MRQPAETTRQSLFSW